MSDKKGMFSDLETRSLKPRQANSRAAKTPCLSTQREGEQELESFGCVRIKSLKSILIVGLKIIHQISMFLPQTVTTPVLKSRGENPWRT